MATDGPPDVLVVGGGAIGLAIAWRAARRGMSVALLERDGAGEGTSRVAAGMLAPVAEVEFGGAGRRMLELALRSAALWPGFAAELQAASGAEIAMRPTGTLLLARDDDEEAELERQLEFRRSLGLEVRRLRPSEAREREPALAPTLRAALEAPGDHSVDPRPVLRALREACIRAGVEMREHTPLAGLERDGRTRAGGDPRRWRARGGRDGRAGSGAVERDARRAARGGARAGAARSRVRSCGCATRRARGCWNGSCATRAATWCRAATAATSSAAPSRSAAST